MCRHPVSTIDKGYSMDEEIKESEGEGQDEVLTISRLEYNKLTDELVQYKDKYLRLYAEFENARKRMEREKIEFIKYANEGIISEFLSVLDNLERTVEVAQAKHEDYEAFLKGVEMVMKNLYEMLKSYGVKPIDAKGKMFDPHCHEILIQEETDSVEEATVLEELQKGYYLEDKVLRTAKVKVAKKKDND